MKGNSVLTHFNVRGCKVDAQGTTQIAQEMRRMTTLIAIDFSYNEFNSSGMDLLGKPIRFQYLYYFRWYLSVL